MGEPCRAHDAGTCGIFYNAQPSLPCAVTAVVPQTVGVSFEFRTFARSDRIHGIIFVEDNNDT